MQGQIVRTLVWSMQNGGRSVITWDGTNANGTPVPGGTYVIQLEFQDKAEGKRLVIIR
jgi:flagellar hook assembly protein FlgD